MDQELTLFLVRIKKDRNVIVFVVLLDIGFVQTLVNLITERKHFHIGILLCLFIYLLFSS